MEEEINQDDLRRELQEARTFIDMLLQHLPMGVAVSRIDDGTATIVNEQFGEIYGWPGEALTDPGKFFRNVYPDEAYRTEVQHKLAKDGAAGHVAPSAWNDFVITTLAGEKRTVMVKNIPLVHQNRIISIVLEPPAPGVLSELRTKIASQEALINGTQDQIWSVDAELRIMAANHSFLEMIKMITGVSLREGDSILVDAFGPKQLSEWKLYYERALKGERFTIKDEHYNPIRQAIEYSLISLSPLYNAEGQVFGVACYSKNITADTLNLMALKNTRNELKKILDFSLDMIVSVDAFGYILSVSAASEAILGYQPDELRGRLLFDFVYRPDLEKTERMLAHLMAGNDVKNFENRYVRKNGSLVPLIWSIRWDPRDKIRYSIARDATERKKIADELIESGKKYKYLFENNPLPALIWDFETLKIVDANEEALLKYGYSRDELLKLTIRDIQAEDDIPLEENLKKEASYEKIHKKIWKHTRRNGEIMLMDVSGHSLLYNGRQASLILANDVTEGRYYDELDKLEKNILEMYARHDKSLADVIGIYLSEIERLHPGMLCSLQELRGARLFNLASPGLPAEYLEAIEGVEIGRNTGACGTAAFLKQKVIAIDIANDERWEGYKEIASKHQLKTCWSYPILDGKNNVMATFACYYRMVKMPSFWEENTIQRAGNILQVILESYQREHALKISNERFEYVTEATSDIIWDWNLDAHTVYYSGNIKKLFGHKPGLNHDNLPFFSDHVHPDDRERVVLYTDQVKYGTMINWTQEYRFRKANGEYAFVLDKGIVIRDENGLGIRMIGAMQDITALKQNELRVIQQNERLTEIALINAHEIRRPIANILGLMGLFSREAVRRDTDSDIMEHLEAATRELDEAVRRIIDRADI